MLPMSFLEIGDDDDLRLGLHWINQLPGPRKFCLSGLWIISPSAFGPHPRLLVTHCPALEHLHMDCVIVTLHRT